MTALSAVQASGSPSGEPDPTVGPQVSKRVTESTATDSPLIGRGPEYEHLVARLPGARGELSRVIAAVTGESGIGKTHVLREVARQARRNGCLVVWTTVREGEWQPPYQPWVDVLGEAFASTGWPESGTEPLPWVGTLMPLIPMLGQWFPRVTPPGHLSSQEERFRLADAITHALIDMSHRHPLMVVIDDLQWADSESLQVLQHIGVVANGWPPC